MESEFVKMPFKRTFMGFAVQCPRSQGMEMVPLPCSREAHALCFPRLEGSMEEREAAMQILLALTGIVSAAMLVYLVYVLLKGENL